MGNRKTIGVLVNRVDNYFEQMTVAGIDDVARIKDCNVIVVSVSYQSQPDWQNPQNDKVYNFCNSSRLDGLIILSGAISFLISNEKLKPVFEPSAKLPKVSVSAQLEGIPGIISENINGMKEVVTHLIDSHQYRKIGFLCGPEDSQDAEERYIGYIEALAKRGIPIDTRIIFKGDFQSRSGFRLIDHYLNRNKNEMDALVSANDEMLIGAYQALEKHGLRIPKDIALAGFDDIDSMKILTPPATTVRQPFYQMGRRSVEILLDLIEGREVKMIETVPSQIVVRKSCGCKASGPDFLLVGHPEGKVSDPRIMKENMLDLMQALVKERLGLNERDSVRSREYLLKMAEALERDAQGDEDSESFISFIENHLDDMAVYPSMDGVWEKAFIIFKDAFLGIYCHSEYRGKVIRLLKQAQMMISLAIQESRTGFELMNKKKGEILRDISHGILSSLNRQELIHYISENLPLLGIGGCYMALYHKEDMSDLNFPLPSFLNLFFNRGFPVSVQNEYPALHILPDSLIPKDERFIWLLEPLLFGNKQFGIIVFQVDILYISYYGVLQEQICLALNNIMHLEARAQGEESLLAAYKQLEMSEEYFRNMVIHLPFLVLETNLSGRFTFLNKAGMEAFGFNDDFEISGVSLFDFMQNKDRQRLSSFYKAAEEGQNNTYNEFQLLNREGVKISLLNQAAPIFQKGKVVGLRWSAINIEPFLAAEITLDDDFFRNYHFPKRRRLVLFHMLKGLSSKSIAKELGITEGAVKFQSSSIYREMGVKNKKEMIRLIKEDQTKKLGYEPFFLSILDDKHE